MGSINLRNIIRMVLGAVLVAGLFLPAGVYCQPPMTDVIMPQCLRDFFGQPENASWVLLPIADSTFLPGSIIEVRYSGPIRSIAWIDELKECYPPEAIKIISGNVPGINLTGNRQFNTSLLLDIYGWKPGAEFSRVRNVVFEINGVGTERLGLLHLRNWDEQNYDKLSKACKDEMEACKGNPNRYIVCEAFIVKKGTYTLKDNTGAAIKLDTPAAIGKFVKIGGNVKYDVTREGKLVIDNPVVFAVRRAVKCGRITEPVPLIEMAEKEKPDAADTADNILREVFNKGSKIEKKPKSQ